jgi:hypothetical protein
MKKIDFKRLDKTNETTYLYRSMYIVEVDFFNPFRQRYRVIYNGKRMGFQTIEEAKEFINTLNIII